MRPWSSLRRKLPLLISTLLCLVVSAVCWSAYRQVEDVLVESMGTRLSAVTPQLADLLEGSARRVREETRLLAADSAVVAALTLPSVPAAHAAQLVLERAQAAGPQAHSYALWDRYGARVLAVGPLVPTGDGQPSPPTSLGIGPLVRAGDGVVFEVTTPVVTPVIAGERDTIGILASYRRVSSGPSAILIGQLIGAEASLLVGNAVGAPLWTDFSTVVDGPPQSLPPATPTEYAAADGERLLGVASPIRGTPWLVEVHRPRAAALAPARDFVLHVIVVALICIALGTGGAWVLSHRITAPLAEVTRAAADVAQGDYARRVDIVRGDEVGSLATSFNSMAAQVEAAARDLQGYAGELEAANAGLRESEERYRGLVEAAHEGICTVDPAGIVTYVNVRLAAMLAHQADALCGRSIFDFMAPESAHEARSRFARRERGSAESRELPFLRQDGTTLWTQTSMSFLFDAEGAFTGALFMLSDVTARHEAQERLVRSERHFRALTENASDMVLVLDARGIARYVSPALERYAGPTDERILGAPAAARIHPEDVATVQAALARIIAEPTQPVHVQYRYRDATGRWRHFSSVGTNLLADPAVQGIVVNSRDTTEERSLEVQLHQAQKMDAVGQLAAGVSHDFNNLLTVMTIYTDLVLDDMRADDPTRADLEEVRRASQRAASLTRQLLAFSRQQVLQPRVLDVNSVVRELEAMLGRVLREDVRLETSLAPTLGRVYADPGQLEQVIVNLAVNARDAMPGGGALTITTADVELDADYARLHAEVTPGPYVMVAVSDTGTGMNAATQARIFEPFFTTKELGKGTGLGLSTVYGIVRQSGGHVGVYSEPGVGTSLKVYLPRDAGAPAARPRSSAVPALHHGSGTILLAEDEASVRKAARRILERAGYTVLEAASGVDALRLCAEHGAAIDLLLTDIVMPDMNGRELTARFRELHPRATTVFMSGYTADAALRQEAFEPGAVFVEKPFTPQTLTQKLREALAPA